MEKIKELQEIINKSKNIVFFGGAGVSTASGINDFRGKNGLYKQKKNLNPEYLLSIECFEKEPQKFYKFYKNNMNCMDKEPNTIHYYLTMLEKEKKLKAIITQNIDGLHQKAGSKNVLEIHGTIHKNSCLKCKKEYDAKYVFDNNYNNYIPICECGGIIKPDTVLFGEFLPKAYDKAKEYIQKADTLIVAGTSLVVEPASSLIKLFEGKDLIIINNTKTQYDGFATLVINDDLVEVFKKLK